MKVILTDNIRGIGRAGDIREVSDGYARNFLFPRGLGRPATESSVLAARTLQVRKAEAQELGQSQARDLAERIAGTTLVITAKANDKGTLFSAVTAAEVAKQLGIQTGTAIPADAVSSAEHLKHTGPHTVTLRLGDKLTADITVDIKPQ